MPIRAKYTLGKTRPSATRQFTNRKEFIQIFQKSVKESQQEKHHILTFYGVGGIGKTSLRKKLVRLLEKNTTGIVSAVLDFEVPRFREQETALFVLRKLLKKRYKVQFPTFDIAYAVYWRKTRPQIPMNKENFPILGEGGVIGDMISIVGTLSGVPMIGLVMKAGKLMLKAQKYLQDWWIKRGKQELSTLSQFEPKEIAERLPMYWAADLKDHLQQKKLSAVLFVDSFDALWEGARSEARVFLQDEWVRELVSQLPEVLWVICGRERLRWQEYDIEWGKYLKQYLVDGLTDEDAKHFLQSCQITDETIQKVIVEGSKGVPYYLDLAVDTYFEIRDHGHREPAAADFATTPKEVFIRFFRYLDKSEIETLKVLSVPRFWDYALFEQLVSEFKTGYPITAFAELCRFSFVNQGETTETWTMHQLMRESLKERLDPNVATSVHKSLFDHYNDEYKNIDVKNITDEQKSALNEAFYHGTFCLDATAFFNWFTTAAAIFNQAAQWKLLIPLYEKTTAILEKALGHEHGDVANTIDQLAKLHHAQADYSATESLYKRALKIREKVFGKNDPNVAQSLNNLADLLRDQGKYPEAEKLYTRALKIRKNSFGPNNYYVAESMNSLAVLLWNHGRYEEAEPYFKQAIEIREKTLESGHPEIAESVNNLAMCYWKQGKYAQAEPLCRRALQMREKTLGPFHHNVAESANNLAMIYTNLEQYVKAEQLFKQALGISEKAFGPDHFKAAIFINNLAMLYWKQSKYTEAEPLYKQALGILERNLGVNHPRLAIALDNLAKLYCSQRRYAEAAPLALRALEIAKDALGRDHPDLARCLNTLANCYRDQGKFSRAEPLYTQALGIWEKVHGQKHPDMAVLLDDMAHLYRIIKKNDEAQRLEERAKLVRSQKPS